MRPGYKDRVVFHYILYSFCAEPGLIRVVLTLLRGISDHKAPKFSSRMRLLRR